ncbi:MAG: DUF1761 domain-containing protein [Woeseiaceae bacterium]|nr:DUF1761 domain-containing protein [Woeseiaceae bacterium]
MTEVASPSVSSVNIKAVIAVAIGAFIAGGVWYSPLLFEGAWMSAHGYSRADVDSILGGLVPFGFIGTFAAYLVTCLVTAVLCRTTDARTWRAGAVLGSLLWAGYAASIGLTTALFSTSSISGWIIDSAFQLVFLVASGAVLAVWR